MSACRKYCVTLSCLPEADCGQPRASDGQPCVQSYFVYATTSKDAIEDAVCRSLQNCPGRPGLCEVRTEVEVVDEEVVD